MMTVVESEVTDQHAESAHRREMEREVVGAGITLEPGGGSGRSSSAHRAPSRGHREPERLSARPITPPSTGLPVRAGTTAATRNESNSRPQCSPAVSAGLTADGCLGR